MEHTAEEGQRVLKKCADCLISKPINEFYMDKGQKPERKRILKTLVFMIAFFSGCAAIQKQWTHADFCATDTCPMTASKYNMTSVGGQYDPESGACSCALAGPGNDVTIMLVRP